MDNRKAYFADRKAFRAFQQSFAEAVSAAAKKSAGHFVSPRNTHRLRHGGEWHSPANPQASPGQILTHSAEALVTIPELIDQRLEVLERSINEVAEKMHGQFVRAFVQMMEEVTAETGNVVNGASRPMTETFLEMLENSHWSVNEAGEIEPPTLMSGSQAHVRLTEFLRQAPPEFSEKANAIIERKTEAAHREEVERKARFSRYGET